MFVTPGFINIHSHASPDALPTAVNMLTQGVTTEIFNADGNGPLDIAQQMATLAAPGLAVNIGGYIGFNSAWQSVNGTADKRPTPAEIDQMRGLIAKGLEQGAWGVSAGLDYKPGYFARTEEVIKVVDVARSARTNFTNHDRITPESNYSSKVGVAETVAIGQKAGLVPVVTHMKAQGLEQGTAGTLLASMDQATRQGAYTAADAYPYLAGQSGLGSLISPGWAQEGGRDAMLKRFADPAQRARIIAESEQAMAAYGAVRLWAEAVKGAGSADASTVRSTISHQTIPSPEGVIAVDPDSRHAWRNLAVGRIRSDGQVDTLWSTRGPTRPTPFPATRTRPEWTKFLVTVQREKAQRRAAPSPEPRSGATP